METRKRQNTEVRSREEAVELLRLLKAISDRPGSGLAELAELLGWGKSSVARRVTALRKAGFEIRTGENAKGGGYYLTESPGVLDAVLGKKRSLPSTVYYTDEDLIERLKEMARELGRTPMAKDIEEAGFAATVCRHFGSTWQALEAAGLAHRISGPSMPRYSEEDLISAIRKKAGELGRPPMEKEWDLSAPSFRTLVRRFGSWREALRRAGFEGGRSPCSDEELVSTLKAWAKEFGRAPAMLEVRGRRPAPETIARRFGSWKKALELAGLAWKEARGTPEGQSPLPRRG